MLKEFETKYNSLNTHIKEKFEKTVTFKHVRRIEELENLLEHRKEEIMKLNSQMKRGKTDTEKAFKQKEIEYELLKMDFQSAIAHRGGAAKKEVAPSNNGQKKNSKQKAANVDGEPKKNSKRGRKPRISVDTEEAAELKENEEHEMKGEAKVNKKKTTSRPRSKKPKAQDFEDEDEEDHIEQQN